MAEIVTFGKTDERVTVEVNPAIKDMLETVEGMITRIRSGNIVGIAFCTLERRSDGNVGIGTSWWCDGEPGRQVMLMAAAHQLCSDQHDALRNGVRETPDD